MEELAALVRDFDYTAITVYTHNKNTGEEMDWKVLPKPSTFFDDKYFYLRLEPAHLVVPIRITSEHAFPVSIDIVLGMDYNTRRRASLLYYETEIPVVGAKKWLARRETSGPAYKVSLANASEQVDPVGSIVPTFKRIVKKHQVYVSSLLLCLEHAELAKLRKEFLARIQL